MKAAFQGLRALHEESQNGDEKPDYVQRIHEWFYAVQGLQAFSVGCIAFARNSEDEIEVLMVRRKFPGFSDRVYTWPGGRILGVKYDGLLPELKRLVKEETGVEVDLLSVGNTCTVLGSHDTKEIPTFHPKQSDRTNRLVRPPFLVMEQHREQRNEVPGHVDLIYVAHIKNKPAHLMDGAICSEVEAFLTATQRSELWPDTRGCIRLAKKEFERVSLPNPSASPPYSKH